MNCRNHPFAMCQGGVVTKSGKEWWECEYGCQWEAGLDGSITWLREIKGEKAKTDDADKLPLAWLPWAAIEAMNGVQLFGHKKYNDFNNYRKGMEVTRNASCALRHIKEYLKGNTIDPESGLHHLAHAMCRLAFILQNEADGKAIDDRYRGPNEQG